MKLECVSFPGGLSLCQPINRSEYFWVVGSGANEEFPTTKLLLWDQRAEEVVAHVDFKEPIQEIKFCVRWLAVSTTKLVLLFDWESQQGIDYERYKCEINKPIKGRLNLTCNEKDGSNAVLMFPGFKPNSCQVVTIADPESKENSVPNQKSFDVNLKDTAAYSCSTISKCGTYSVFTNAAGWDVRVFHLPTNTLIKAFLRGNTSAQISSLAIAEIHGNEWAVILGSHKADVHYFKLEVPDKPENAKAQNWVENDRAVGQLVLPDTQGGKLVLVESDRTMHVVDLKGPTYFQGRLNQGKFSPILTNDTL